MEMLVAGGPRFMGSHIAVALPGAGHEVAAVDNSCSNSSIALERVGQVVCLTLRIVQGAICDLARTSDRGIKTVIPFVALKGRFLRGRVTAFRFKTAMAIAHHFVERRAGYASELTANPVEANEKSQWRTTRGLDAMCVGAGCWQLLNPDGYDSSCLRVDA